MTAGTLIQSSLRLLGALASGAALSGTQAQECLEILSELLDAWASERLTMYAQARDEYALVGGTQRYTLGSGGTWDGTRPLWIDRATRKDSAGLETEIEILTQDKWAQVTDKAFSGVPEAIYVNKTFPLAAVDVYPVPEDASYSIVLYRPSAPLKSVAALSTAISVPEGWPRALRYNLALELAPWAGVEPLPSVIATAIDSKAAIQRPNEGSGELVIDAALLVSGRSSLSASEFETL